jgi:hypothetical protein
LAKGGGDSCDIFSGVVRAYSVKKLNEYSFAGIDRWEIEPSTRTAISASLY